MQKPFIPLEPNRYYHIYNRGVNGENIFKQPQNYEYFLTQYAKYVSPVVDTFAYCLLKNHFHLLIRVKDFSNAALLKEIQDKNNWKKIPDVSRQFSHFFNSYAQSINKAYNRTGLLFETPFERKLVDNDAYFTRAVFYIHSNPQRHGFVNDYRDYLHSSYHSHLQSKTTKLMRKEVIDWFGNVDEYVKFHNLMDFRDIDDDFVIEID
jgi:putative transposase